MSKVYIVSLWIDYLKRFKIQEVFTSLGAARQYIISEGGYSDCEILDKFRSIGDYYITEKEAHLNMNSLNKAKYFKDRATALAKLTDREKELLGLI